MFIILILQAIVKMPKTCIQPDPFDVDFEQDKRNAIQALVDAIQKHEQINPGECTKEQNVEIIALCAIIRLYREATRYKEPTFCPPGIAVEGVD